jgi:hypothetical protein
MAGQQTLRLLAIGIAGACAVAAGCTSASESTARITSSIDAEPTPSPTETSHGSNAPTSPKVPTSFDPKNFGPKLSHVNPWLPMTTGVQAISRGFVTVGSRRIPHIRITTVTDVTKEVNGVHAVLVLDQDVDDGQVTETAIDYLAQDDGGNVWYIGSYTEAYEAGQFMNAEDAWLAGENGAQVGLYFPGDPKAGTPPFMQVSIEGGEQSSAQVVEVGTKTCVTYDCFTDVVVVEEGGSEHKYWAPGVGGVLTEPLSGTSQETEELINLKELSPAALGELSKEAMRLDAHAAIVVPSVFGASAPAVRGR